MDANTATLVLMGLRIFEDLVNGYNNPIVDRDGNVVAQNLKEFKLKKGEELFKQVFGKDLDEIQREVENLKNEG